MAELRDEDLLRDEDRRFLHEHGHQFDAVLENNMICLVVNQFPLPDGYAPRQVDLLLRLPLQFPEAAPDMFWLSPTVTYANGAAPAATQLQEIYLDRAWQRWSRHFAGVGGSQWRPGVDDLRSYVQLIKSVLRNEVQQLAA